MRSVAGSAVASYGISNPDQADEYLLPGLTYIYPVDPTVSTRLAFSLPSSLSQHPQTKKLREDKPYRHPAIEATIRAAFFNRRDGEDFLELCGSSLAGSEEPEVPIAMVALSATAVCIHLFPL